MRYRHVLLLANLCIISIGDMPWLSGQSMPREDVVDVAAISDGFCVSNVFQSGMVLQRDKPCRIWGWADPGQKVSVTFADQESMAIAGRDRRWEVLLPALSMSGESRTLVARTDSETVELNDVLVGDVWILGGQSNMEFELAKVENGNLEIISANYPKIRILTLPYAQGPDKQKGFPRLHQWSDWSRRHFRKGDWNVCTPEIAKELSAIGYVFARRVHQASSVPIGVIDASRGGTTVETWTPLPVLQEITAASVQGKIEEFEQSVSNWDPRADLVARVKQHEAKLQRLAKEGKEVSDAERQPPTDLRPGPIGNHNYPGHCYAGMIAPLEGLSVKGVIFHQGYNNAFDGTLGAELYREVFPKMIQSWRQAFRDTEMPFGILSLCTDGNPQTLDDYCEKMFNAGIDIRAAQYSTFLDFYQNGDENIGFVSTYDLRRRWYHPQLKLPAGERIARWALATEYGFEKQIEWLPPMLIKMEQIENGLELTFNRDVGDPEDGKIRGFAIAGVDRRFHPADAEYAVRGKNDRGQVQYDKKRLVLSSQMISEPIHYRYAWGRNPLANLQATGNKDLPFATQRSDTWVMEEVPLGVLGEQVTLPISRADRGKILQVLRQQDEDRLRMQVQSTLEELNKRTK
ncbi:MAG: hypothetical protein VX694_03150 [Planctomycetota bacterium]|nr:hypothetical protein [Planctomycetota bacterium]